MLSFLRLLLFPFALLFVSITEIRNLLFNWRIMRSSKFDIPTIGIGNLSVGGTGKSPHAEYLIEFLKNRYKVATLSRGYGRKTKGYFEVKDNDNSDHCGDEPLQFKTKHKDIVVAVDENRVRGVMNLVHDHPDLDLILLDDVFQHRPIKPGLQILLTEFQSPFYKDFILPAGNLRELRKNAERADLVIVTKCPDEVNENDKKIIEQTIWRYCNRPVFFSSMKYGTCYPLFSDQELKTYSAEKEILAFSGIANPLPFHNYLKTKTQELKFVTFNDHHRYQMQDIEKVEKEFNSFATKGGIVITTEKDAMRLRSLEQALIERMKKLPIFVLPISIHISNHESFNAIIDDYIAKNRSNHIENQIINRSYS